MIDTSSGSTTAAVGFTALAVMGAYLCRHRLFCPEPPRSIVEEDDDNEERTPVVTTPVEPRPPPSRRLRFGDPIQRESPIPGCATRRAGSGNESTGRPTSMRKFATTSGGSSRRCCGRRGSAARANSRHPFLGRAGEGLGLICEPGTNSGRAARVRSARRAVVEAQRDGYCPRNSLI